MNDMNGILIVVIAVGSVLLFWAIREVICWYFKINERVKLLQEIRDHLIPDDNNQKDEEEPEKEE